MSEPIFFFGTMYGRDELRYIILTSRVLFIFFQKSIEASPKMAKRAKKSEASSESSKAHFNTFKKYQVSQDFFNDLFRVQNFTIA